MDKASLSRAPFFATSTDNGLPSAINEVKRAMAQATRPVTDATDKYQAAYHAVAFRISATVDKYQAAARGGIEIVGRRIGAMRAGTHYRFSTENAEVTNRRDIGASTADQHTRDGSHLRKGQILRMAAPTNADLKMLKDFGIDNEIDLRSQRELLDEQNSGSAPTWRTAGPSTDDSIHYENDPIGGLNAYGTFDDDRDVAFAKAMVSISQSSGATLINCTHGADRTGMLTATLMMTLGFRREDARREYLRSGASWEGDDVAGKNFDQAWANVDHRFGSFAGYLDHLNALYPAFDSKTVAALKTKLLEADSGS